MRLHYLQHVPFEGLGMIEEWARSQGMDITCTRLYRSEQPPEPDAYDILVVMGGPMGIYDEEEHPWLPTEKCSVRSAIRAGKRVLGICLGAQLIADALGVRVYPNPNKEIGWFPIERDPGAPSLLPKKLTVFHWHGDTFDLPKDTVRLASSEACMNQGFIYNERVVGLQFHLETTVEGMNALIEHCAEELADDRYIQTAEQMRDGAAYLPPLHQALHQLLTSLVQ